MTVPALAVVDDPPARRIRNSLDGIRLVGLVGLLLLLSAFATLASDTTLGANEDLKRGVSHLPSVLVDALTIVGGIGALAVPVALVVRALMRGQQRRLVDALLAGLITLVVVAAIDIAVDHAKGTALYQALVVVSRSGATEPLDIYLAAWLALATVLGVAAEKTWGTVSAAAAAVYALSTFIAAQASLLSIIVSVGSGITVGVAMRYVAGAVNDRPDAAAIAAALAPRGLGLVGIERIAGPRPLHRLYRATTDDGRSLHIDVLDRDEAGYGWFYRLYRSVRVQPEVAGGPELSIERTAERRSLLAYAAAAAGAQIPAFLGAVVCGPDTIVLVYVHHDSTPLDALPQPPNEQQVRAIWRSLERLHDERVSHPGLAAGRIQVEADGGILLPILETGTAFASDLRLSLDRAQLLTTTAQLIGATDAVRIARDELGDAALTATLPVLQPVALGRETRQWLRKHRALLDEIRSQIQGLTHAPPAEPFRLERVRPRTVITLVALIVAAYLLIGQVGSLNLSSVLHNADWRWVPLLLVASTATYFAAALSLIGFVRERISFARTLVVQLAGSFTSFVTPPAVGGFAVNLRFLQKAGLSTTAAATSVGVSQVVNAVLHVVLLLGFAAATGTQADHRLPIPSWAFIALGVIAVLVLIAIAVPRPRRWLLGKVLPPIREALPRLLELATDPTKLVEAIGGTLLLNLCYIAALWCAMSAFHGDVNFVGVAVVYLAGGAIGSLAPTPGGLGAVEAALSTGLAAAGMPGAAAVSAVLLYRLATFWLPVPLGWIAMQVLQRRNAI
jgi:glycosyltransferase 2 family protein